MEKQATIREVAKLAGVSVATASRALNNSDYPVNAKLRQKVKEAAEQLEYVPNIIARSLRGDTSKDIGLVIPNVSNPFYLQTMLGINDVLAQNSYHMILCNTMRDVEQEHRFLCQLYERQTKGVILSSVDDNAELIQKYSKLGMKFIMLDQMLDGVESPGINFDSRAGARMAVEYLIKQGHEKIAFATMSMTRWTRIEMYEGYREALLVTGLPLETDLIFECGIKVDDSNSDLEMQAGGQIAEDFLRKGCPATAILCINDMLAIGMIRTLLKNGKKVPDDVSVMGFDDIPFAGAFIPPLTTIHYPAVETGRLAALMLLDLLRSQNMSISMNLAPQLVIRDTVAKRPV